MKEPTIMTKERVEVLMQQAKIWRTECLKKMYKEHSKEYNIAKMEMENYIIYLETLIKAEK